MSSRGARTSGGGVDRLLAAAGVDPALGVQVVSGRRLTAVPFDPSLPLVLLAAPATGGEAGVLPGRHSRGSAQAVLLSLYPHDHPLRPLPDGTPRLLEGLTDD